ncbi:hypothetical protein KSS87_020160 [Heliosperma pusillum]|nr:hypothetical protein KSS87_020160 [Heliosperma pusillum]
MEVIRLLVQNTQNTKRIRQAFVISALLSKVEKVAAIFLAVPELFLSAQGGGLSSLSELVPEVNSWENKTEMEKQLSLLLDVLSIIGPKLAAYIRLEESAVISSDKVTDDCDQSLREMNFFLGEVARKKLGDSSLDYYLRRKDFNRTDIYRYYQFSSCVLHETVYQLVLLFLDLLNNAVEKKLSSISTLHDCLQTNAKILKQGDEEHLSLGAPLVSHKSFEPGVRSFNTGVARPKPIYNVKCTLTKSRENKVVQSTKRKFFFSTVRLTHFPLVAKRLLR